ncbi:hypothetical protein D5S18_09630 [Nocardia panacis]|uniref:Uncharacterized protein n=1 Tax=Nocardia panacis TaxID=2340916 RepID=A0A3A4KMJ6_9NOCA|nr:hypothetical protein [Nocardia panacis]RJO76547.1 hypothetical protein D5S18_09630 [Nocardia panacis]
MVRKWSVVLVDAVVAAICLVVAVVSWRAGTHSTVFAAAGDIPAYTSTRYAPPWLLLAGLLVVVAGIAAIDGMARGIRTIRA